MISLFLNTGCQRKNRSNVVFGSLAVPPTGFTVVKDNFLYRGGTLSKELENIDPIKQLRFLIAKGVKSILCFVDPKEYRHLIYEELDLIGNHNKDNPFAKINMDFLPCWVSKEKFNLNRLKIKTDFVEKLNKLQSPIYMHCLAGRHIAEEMDMLFKEAMKEGKINF